MGAGDTDEEAPPAAARPEDIRAVPVRRPGRWLAAGLVVLVAATLLESVITNPRFGWPIVGD